MDYSIRGSSISYDFIRRFYYHISLQSYAKCDHPICLRDFSTHLYNSRLSERVGLVARCCEDIPSDGKAAKLVDGLYTPTGYYLDPTQHEIIKHDVIGSNAPFRVRRNGVPIFLGHRSVANVTLS